jgi:hypothetical protein
MACGTDPIPWNSLPKFSGIHVRNERGVVGLGVPEQVLGLPRVQGIPIILLKSNFYPQTSNSSSAPVYSGISEIASLRADMLSWNGTFYHAMLYLSKSIISSYAFT